MSTRFFTNTGNNTLLAKFAGVFAHNPDIEWFDALVGYLRASGYFAIRPHIEKVPHVRILVGIDVDSIMADYHKRGLLFLADPTKSIEQFKKNLQNDIQNAAYSPEVEQGVLRFVDDVTTRKIELRAHPARRLHAKLFIFRPIGFNEHKAGAVITGSSNLTDAGLGTHGEASNYEFNVLLHDYDDVEFASDEFEKLWGEAVAVLPEAVRGVVRESYLRDDLTPFELYIKFLTEYFGPAIEYDPNSERDLPKGVKPLSYQADAVNDGWLKLQKHGGFFLADVVGLGKTIVAARIAKKFYYHNGFPNHRSRILVIAPPALKENWEAALEKFGLDDATRVLNNGSLHKIRDPEKYDLIIVDEAHKFRNDTADGYDLLQKLCKTKCRYRLPNGEFAKKRVILISATPLNNRPADIRNQVLLFQDGKDSTVIGNLQHFFAQRIKEYEIAINPKKTPDRHEAHATVARIYKLIREQVVQPLTVRRTRTDLLADSRWSADLVSQGIVFPHVEKPRPIFYRLDDKLDDLYDRTIQMLALPERDGLTYNRYRAIAFLRPELKQRYQNADLVATQLARIMKTMLVKRLDSSFLAFTNSLRRFRDATHAMLMMFERGHIYIAPNLKVSDYILDDREDELIDAIAEASETDPTITICKPVDFLPGFFEGLQHDSAILDDLVAQWEAVEGDPKLEEFLACLLGEGGRQGLLASPFNETGKLVIFSEARDTTLHLAERLNAAGFGPVLTVDSHNRKSVMSIVRANFDANVAHDAGLRHDDYKILISTEVLAEGVNLHRAHVIVNYDTPWNSTRLMQRIGRVNRIGSTAAAIHIFNFYPTAQVDSDIDLQRKAFLKLQAFHSALGEDSQIYSPEEEVDNFGLFDRDIEEERDERLRFLSELRDFKDAHPDEFRRIRHLPLRARCGRRDEAHAGSSLVFIRNARRDAFYRIVGTTEEIGFVEMARAFRAEVADRAVPLHDAHHAQVLAAVEDFRTKVQTDAIRERAVDYTAGPNEQKAMRLLAAAQGMPNVSLEEKALLAAAQHAIKVAKFQDLGNVAGDQLKAASDLGVPVVGVGLLYQQGYFRQVIDKDGAQQALYPYNDPGQLPITPLRQANGEWLRLEIALPGYSVWLRAWQVQVGRVKLYLLDSNDAANFPAHRGITSELYGGGPELRLKQELLLGIGGWRLLAALGIRPEVCHLNEGHAAFAVLERARSFMEETGQPFEAALAATRAGNLFTTHTAVAAGFDRFPPALIEQYLGRYAQEKLGISLNELLALADATVQCLLRAVPAAVPGIAFLSGGQSGELASARLNAMNVRFKLHLPWALAFSFARAIQQPALEIWRGEEANLLRAQRALYHRARCNRAARRGTYDTRMETDGSKSAPPEGKV